MRRAERTLARTAAAFRRFGACTRAMGAVEFALVLPILLTLYFGTIALSNGVATKQRLELVVRTVSDLTTRIPQPPGGTAATINDSQVNDIAAASASVMDPYENRGMTITIASVVVRAQGSTLAAKVCWSASRRIESSGTLVPVPPPAALVTNASYAVPSAFRIDGSSYIVGDVRQTYRPVVGYGVVGDIDLEERALWPLRSMQQIKWTGTPGC